MFLNQIGPSSPNLKLQSSFYRKSYLFMGHGLGSFDLKQATINKPNSFTNQRASITPQPLVGAFLGVFRPQARAHSFYGPSGQFGKNPNYAIMVSALPKPLNPSKTKKVDNAIGASMASSGTDQRPNKSLSITQEIAKLNKFLFSKNFICCKESRIESANSFYASFYLGPFEESFSQTLAHNLRRTLLSELTGLAITAVEIDGVLHRFSSIPGTKETTMDILSNLQNVVLKKAPVTLRPQNHRPLSQKSIRGSGLGSKDPKQASLTQDFTTKAPKALSSTCYDPESLRILTNQIAYVRTRGPGVVRAADILLPSGIECVNPDQHLATLAEDGILNMKLIINEGKNAIKQNLDNIYAQNPYLRAAGSQASSNYNWGLGVSPFMEGSEDLTYEAESSMTMLRPEEPSQHLGQEDMVWAKTPNQTYPNSNLIFLDSVFMPVTKVNAFVEANAKATDVVLETSPEFINPSSKTIQDILENFYAAYDPTTQRGYVAQKEDNPYAGPLGQSLNHEAHNNKGAISEPRLLKPRKVPTQKPFFKVMPDQTTPLGGNNTSASMVGALYSNHDSVSSGLGSLDPKQAPMAMVEGANHFLVLAPSNNINVTPQANDGGDLKTPTIKMDYKPESQILLDQPKSQCHIVLEIWTNGSIHPRQALKASLDLLTSTFFTLNNVKQLGSMYKSDLTYKKILRKL